MSQTNDAIKEADAGSVGIQLEVFHRDQVLGIFNTPAGIELVNKVMKEITQNPRFDRVQFMKDLSAATNDKDAHGLVLQYLAAVRAHLSYHIPDLRNPSHFGDPDRSANYFGVDDTKFSLPRHICDWRDVGIHKTI